LGSGKSVSKEVVLISVVSEVELVGFNSEAVHETKGEEGYAPTESIASRIALRNLSFLSERK
jgi:hypothetical protein